MDSILKFTVQYSAAIFGIILVIVFANANPPDRWVIFLRGAIVLVLTLGLVQGLNMYHDSQKSTAVATHVVRYGGHKRNPKVVQAPAEEQFRPSDSMETAFGITFLISAFNPLATLIAALLGLTVGWSLADAGQQSWTAVGGGIGVAAVANALAWFFYRPKQI